METNLTTANAVSLQNEVEKVEKEFQAHNAVIDFLNKNIKSELERKEIRLENNSILINYHFLDMPFEEISNIIRVPKVFESNSIISLKGYLLFKANSIRLTSSRQCDSAILNIDIGYQIEDFGVFLQQDATGKLEKVSFMENDYSNILRKQNTGYKKLRTIPCYIEKEYIASSNFGQGRLVYCGYTELIKILEEPIVKRLKSPVESGLARLVFKKNKFLNNILKEYIPKVFEINNRREFEPGTLFILKDFIPVTSSLQVQDHEYVGLQATKGKAIKRSGEELDLTFSEIKTFARLNVSYYNMAVFPNYTGELEIEGKHHVVNYTPNLDEIKRKIRQYEDTPIYTDDNTKYSVFVGEDKGYFKIIVENIYGISVYDKIGEYKSAVKDVFGNTKLFDIAGSLISKRVTNVDIERTDQIEKDIYRMAVSIRFSLLDGIVLSSKEVLDVDEFGEDNLGFEENHKLQFELRHLDSISLN